MRIVEEKFGVITGRKKHHRCNIRLENVDGGAQRWPKGDAL